MDIRELKTHNRPRRFPRTGPLPVFKQPLVWRGMDVVFESARYVVTRRSPTQPRTHWILDPISDRRRDGTIRPSIELSEETIVQLRAERHADAIIPSVLRTTSPDFAC